MESKHGHRLLPTTIDQLAAKDPNRAWGSMQAPGSLEFYDIPLSVFANAINRVAHWIIATIGKPEIDNGKQPMLAYIGASDLRYYVMFVAMVKAGYVPLFCSHLNSKAANVSLFHDTGCKVLLNGFDDLSKIAIDPEIAKVFDVPSSEEVWDATPVNTFPFNASFDEMYPKPLLILHTSGSSGLPKPITYTHGSFAASDLRQDIPNFEGYIPEPRYRCLSQRALLGLPPFHGAGFVTGLQDSIWFERTIVFPPADRKLDAQCVADIIDNGRIGGAALLPHVLEDLARNPEALEKLRNLRYVAWVGGPISQRTGDLIASRTTLINAYASTELGASNTLIKTDPSLWSWYFFHPDYNGFDFRVVPGQDNLYELFVVRDPSLSQVVFRTFPHLNEWPTKDLFVPHPTLAHHWRLAGRSDDLIVLKNASKLNPRAAEEAVKQAKGVDEAMMFGSGRARAGLLIEPLWESGANEDELLKEVYSHVGQYNSTAPVNGVIPRELVAITKKDKPFPRAGKNTLQRGVALDLYKEEIEMLYKGLPSTGFEDFRIGTA